MHRACLVNLGPGLASTAFYYHVFPLSCLSSKAHLWLIAGGLSFKLPTLSITSPVSPNAGQHKLG